MIQELKKFFKIDTDNKWRKENFGNFPSKFKSKLSLESDSLNFLSEYGILSLIKLLLTFPYSLINEEIQYFFNIFRDYLNGKEIYEKEFYFEDILEIIPIYNFTYAISDNINFKILFSLAFLLNIKNSEFMLYLSLYAIQDKGIVIFKYDDSFNNIIKTNDSYELFKKFYSSIYKTILIYGKNKALSISFKNNKFSSEFIKGNNSEILFNINKDYRILTYYINNNNNNRLEKMINIKHFYLKHLIF